MIMIILTVAVIYALILKAGMKRSFFAAFGLMMCCGIAATFMTIYAYAVIYTV
jgi:hypothetical protein